MKKTKFLCILSICFIFLQCKKDKLNPNVDAEFQPYFQQFFEDLENYRPSLDKNYLDYSIQFDDSISIGPQIGICSEIGGFDVTISRASWEKMDELLSSYLDKNIPNFPKQVALTLPDLGNVKKLELPKLK